MTIRGVATMKWMAVYVTGRPGFDRKVERYLKKLDISFMTGSFSAANTYLFWITDEFDIDSFKWRIGSRRIFKHRLRFFSDVNSFITSRDKNKRKHNFNSNQEQMFRDYFTTLKSSRYRERNAVNFL
jgi:hypothetical protein